MTNVEIDFWLRSPVTSNKADYYTTRELEEDDHAPNSVCAGSFVFVVGL